MGAQVEEQELDQGRVKQAMADIASAQQAEREAEQQRWVPLCTFLLAPALIEAAAYVCSMLPALPSYSGLQS